jgi:restriction system protein
LSRAGLIASPGRGRFAATEKGKALRASSPTRIYVQAKRYAPGNPIGRPDVSAFVGSLVGLSASKGVFVTTSTFSQPARDYVRQLAQRVILIDGQGLAYLMIEHGVGVRSYRNVEFKRLDEDFFGEE